MEFRGVLRTLQCRRYKESGFRGRQRGKVCLKNRRAEFLIILKLGEVLVPEKAQEET